MNTRFPPTGDLFLEQAGMLCCTITKYDFISILMEEEGL